MPKNKSSRKPSFAKSPIQACRRQLAAYLGGSQAHAEADSVLHNFPLALRGIRPFGAPHTAWQLLEHMRIAQWDILEFSANSRHVSPEWPAGYWPATEAPPSAAAWDRSCKELLRGLAAMNRLAKKPSANLFARIPHGEGQTLFREALLVLDHNAYHLGQLVLVRRILGAWPPG
jgi:hypothetical protein